MLEIPMKKRMMDMLPKPLLDSLVLFKHRFKRLPAYTIYISYVQGKRGIEIGGPSSQFRTILPLYPSVSGLDGVNVFQHTIWEGKIVPGKTYNYYGNRKGTQFVSDTTDLSAIPSASYDFLLSCNCLEHIANPLKALLEWKRVVRIGGAIILILPNPASNFDHRRPVTDFDNLLEDFQSATTEDDLSHLDEILALHDLSKDPQAGSFNNFRARSLENDQNRALHHHVFSLELMVKMLTHVGLDVKQASQTDRDFYALAIRNA